MAAFAATMATSWAPSHTTARVVSSSSLSLSSRVASCGVNSVSSVSVAMRSSLRRNSFAAMRASSDAEFINIICSKIRRHSSFCVIARVEFRSRSACGGKDLSRGTSFEKAETMKMAAVLCRNIRRLSTMSSQGSSGLVAKPMAGRNYASSAIWNAESRGTGGARVQSSAMSRVGVVRFMGFGTFNEEHKNAEVPHDESEGCSRLQFMVQVCNYSFGRLLDEADDDEHPEVVIEKASHELFRQSNSIGELQMLDFPLIVLKSARTKYSKTL